jgi:preprotein translocase subunit SecG
MDGRQQLRHSQAASLRCPDLDGGMTDGLAILTAWVCFLFLLGCLAFVVLRGDRRRR